MGSKTLTMTVQGVNISVTTIGDEDYISLTDMLRANDGEFFITDWLRNKNTLEYIGAWEMMYNPDFNYGEFAIIKSHAGLNSFKISVKEWVSRTNAIGLQAKAGRYGGTYAHKDIAFNFGMWISPIFQLYIVKEYQRLKEIESNQYNLEWNVKRVITKANYKIHTDAIKTNIIPNLPQGKNDWIYADEADMLNIIMFDTTAKQWREAHSNRAMNGENIRDVASINDLTILSNLESLNATLIKQGLNKQTRFELLTKVANEQKELLSKFDYMKSVKKISNDIYTQIEDETSRKGKLNQPLKTALDYNPNESKD